MENMINSLLGGMGLFLLGMHLMTEGLKLAAGNSLRAILSRSTRTRLKGIASGALITAIVQASGAVTVATIGFVNAGLLNLFQATAIIYGSNIGTTMTGWLVAILGFHVNIQLLALPAIGIGTFMWLLSKRGRRGPAGQALAGFGLLFLGIDLLRSAFTGLDQSVDLQALYSDSLWNYLLFAGIGFIVTLLMQSSSASIALTLTAAGSGWIPLESAAMMVIGANLGTTSTAVIAVIGATPNAKRAAAAHVLFNLVTGLAAILMLPLLLWMITSLASATGLGSQPATFLALFHTLFNVMGVLLMWPLTPRMVTMLEGRFRAAEEDESRPKYLDKTLADTPSLAQQAMGREIARISGIARRMGKDATSTEASMSSSRRSDQDILVRLVDAVDAFASKLRERQLPEHLAEAFPHALAATRYFKDVSDIAAVVDRMQSTPPGKIPQGLESDLAHFRSQIVKALEISDTESEVFDAGKCQEQSELVQEEYKRLKASLLRAGTRGSLSIRHMVEIIELLKTLMQMVKQITKGALELHTFATYSDEATKTPPASEEPPASTENENTETLPDSH
jgi:phosphate:Na+ symporter